MEPTGGAANPQSESDGTGLLTVAASLNHDLHRRLGVLRQAMNEDAEHFRSSSRIVNELVVWIGLAMLIYVAVRVWV